MGEPPGYSPHPFFLSRFIIGWEQYTPIPVDETHQMVAPVEETVPGQAPRLDLQMVHGQHQGLKPTQA